MESERLSGKVRSTCVCQRPKTNIICRMCGNVMFGRIQKNCTQHPMVVFLCDISNCSECLARTHDLKAFDADGSGSKESNCKENKYREYYSLSDS